MISFFSLPGLPFLTTVQIVLHSSLRLFWVKHPLPNTGMLVHQGSWEAEQLWTQLLSGSPLALPGSVSDEYTLFRRHYPKHFSHTKLSEHHSKMLLTRLVLWKPFCRAQQILAPRFWQLSILKAHSIFSTYIEKICSLNASPRNRKCFLWPYLLTWCLIWDREWGARLCGSITLWDVRVSLEES